MSDGPDVSPEDALQVAQRALGKVNELDSRSEDLEEDLTAATLRLSEFDEDREYDQLTRDDKIGMVREHGFRRAMDSGGRAALDYDDIRWEVFDGGPSPAHCYDLMKWASDARFGADGRRGSQRVTQASKPCLA